MSRTARQWISPPHKSTSWINKPVAIARWAIRWRLLWLILIAFFFLSGCVQYDVGIEFDSQTHGEVVQHIRLSDRFTNFSGTVAQDWLKSLEQRTRQLGGKTRRLGKQELVAILPFNNSADLEEKFNQFFQSTTQINADLSNSPEFDLPDLESHLQLDSSNFLLVERNHLTFDLDLRPLGVLSSNGNVLISPGSLLDLNLSIKAPWGIRSVTSTDAPVPVVRQKGNQLSWTLQSGQLNHLEAIFWVPSPIGIGTVVIVLLVVSGYYLKAQLNPVVGTESLSQPQRELT